MQDSPQLYEDYFGKTFSLQGLKHIDMVKRPWEYIYLNRLGSNSFGVIEDRVLEPDDDPQGNLNTGGK